MIVQGGEGWGSLECSLYDANGGELYASVYTRCLGVHVWRDDKYLICSCQSDP